MKFILSVFAFILFFAGTVEAVDFPIGKFECTVNNGSVIWEISESADHQPLVIFTSLGSGGHATFESLAMIRKVYDAAGTLTESTLRILPAIAVLPYDSTGPTDPSCVKK